MTPVKGSHACENLLVQAVQGYLSYCTSESAGGGLLRVAQNKELGGTQDKLMET